MNEWGKKIAKYFADVLYGVLQMWTSVWQSFSSFLALKKKCLWGPSFFHQWAFSKKFKLIMSLKKCSYSFSSNKLNLIHTWVYRTRTKVAVCEALLTSISYIPIKVAMRTTAGVEFFNIKITIPVFPLLHNLNEKRWSESFEERKEEGKLRDVNSPVYLHS